MAESGDEKKHLNFVFKVPFKSLRNLISIAEKHLVWISKGGGVGLMKCYHGTWIFNFILLLTLLITLGQYVDMPPPHSPLLKHRPYNLSLLCMKDCLLSGVVVYIIVCITNLCQTQVQSHMHPHSVGEMNSSSTLWCNQHPWCLAWIACNIYPSIILHCCVDSKGLVESRC